MEWKSFYLFSLAFKSQSQFLQFTFIFWRFSRWTSNDKRQRRRRQSDYFLPKSVNHSSPLCARKEFNEQFINFDAQSCKRRKNTSLNSISPHTRYGSAKTVEAATNTFLGGGELRRIRTPFLGKNFRNQFLSTLKILRSVSETRFVKKLKLCFRRFKIEERERERESVLREIVGNKEWTCVWECEWMCRCVGIQQREKERNRERERERESYCSRESKRLRSEEWMRKSCVEKGRYCVCERQGWDRVGVGVCDMFICAWSSALIKWTPFALFNAKCFLDVSNKSLAVLPRCGVSKSHWLTFVQDCLFASNISILWYNSH